MACASAVNSGTCRRSRRVEDLQLSSPTACSVAVAQEGRGFAAACLALLLLAGLVDLQEINSNKNYSSSSYKSKGAPFSSMDSIEIIPTATASRQAPSAAQNPPPIRLPQIF